MVHPSLQSVKVLVADDEPSLRALVAECVRGLGCRVVEAADGDEAWHVTQRELPDVVVLDVMMPGMSGWEVCKLVKTEGKSGRGGHPKVLMLTGIGVQLNEMTSPLFAADDWIDKPFALAELAEKIGRLGRQATGAEPVIPPASPSGPDLVKAAPRAEGAKKFGRAHEKADVAAVVRIAGEAAAATSKTQGRKRRKRKRKQLKAQARAQAALRNKKVTARKAAKAKPSPAAKRTAKAKPGVKAKARPAVKPKSKPKAAKAKAKAAAKPKRRGAKPKGKPTSKRARARARKR